ncbi:alpha/beta hydrolase [Silvanigrella aquatica]|uniref:Serine aminopeptidase S33 domain-containing protein n=1 Tax=Silvanigrella aquatica TaxID=1915309 RepID=A0A1L4CZW6_9BACT|nr:alpha/beta hydrolase [Silvanigrella aquatica]APJ03492.1 hypothetical protein AXG55_06060 [Silvanigrella aquatica]
MLQMNVDGFEVYEFPAPNESSTKNALFFAHANGIPAQTYKSLFEKMAQQLNCLIISYDMRGMGRSQIPDLISENLNNTGAWEQLTKDHIQLFLKIKSLKSEKLNWILAGHSLGAWLSLLASKELHNYKLFLLEPPILAPKIILQWTIIALLKKRHLSPRGQRVKRRKTQFPSLKIAFNELKKSSLMKHWDDEVISDYIEGSFQEQTPGGQITLRHDPAWEALMFEEYPIGAWWAFLKIPFQIRTKIQPLFFVGSKSDTCNPNAKFWVSCFFPKLKWIELPDGTHMFPLERQMETISLIKSNLLDS